VHTARNHKYWNNPVSVMQLNSYLHSNSNISAPTQKLKKMTNQFHRINLMNLHAKFQVPSLSSFKTVIPKWISKHPLSLHSFARLLGTDKYNLLQQQKLSTADSVPVWGPWILLAQLVGRWALNINHVSVGNSLIMLLVLPFSSLP